MKSLRKEECFILSIFESLIIIDKLKTTKSEIYYSIFNGNFNDYGGL